MSRPIGIIAGQGGLPLAMAAGIRAAGHPVACVGLAGFYDPALPGLCDHFARAGIIRLGRWVRLLQRWGVREAILIGRVRKTRMYEPLKWIRQLPDWRAARLWYRVLRHDRRTDVLLGALADELQRCGITLISTTRYIPEHMASAGNMTRHAPSATQLADIEFALPIIRRLGELDIGQSLAVRDREVIAVEAIEGTDEMIRRAGALCRSGKWTLLKTAKPQQDPRFDVPTVGLLTIENLHRHGATCLAVEAGSVILLDRDEMIAAADRMGVAIVGVG
ncbi:MAG: hypothetical protein CMJ18_04565 [Phycisphaeraceae bacterium]|nr:hypothetical protein [Phycisphaeraceae bacterium]